MGDFDSIFDFNNDGVIDDSERFVEFMIFNEVFGDEDNDDTFYDDEDED